MDGAPVEKEEVEEKAATNLIDVDNLIEISLKWNVHMKLSYDAGFHKCTYVVFVQDHTDITFLKYNHSAELVNTQFVVENIHQSERGGGLGRTKIELSLFKFWKIAKKSLLNNWDDLLSNLSLCVFLWRGWLNLRKDFWQVALAHQDWNELCKPQLKWSFLLFPKKSQCDKS